MNICSAQYLEGDKYIRQTSSNIREPLQGSSHVLPHLIIILVYVCVLQYLYVFSGVPGGQKRYQIPWNWVIDICYSSNTC